MKPGKKAFNIAAWLLGSFAVLYLLLLSAASIYINHQQERILKYIGSELRPHIRGNISIEALTVSPWSSFPAIDFTIKTVVVTDSLHHLPVFTLKNVSTSFSLLQLIIGKTSINNLSLEDGMLQLRTDSSGYNNNFLYSDSSSQRPPTESSTLSIAQVRLKNISISIVDDRKEKEFSFMIRSLHAHMHTEGNIQHITVTEQITTKRGLGFNLARGAFLENQSINGNWDLQYNVQAKTIVFNDAKVAIGNQPFLLNGKFSFQQDKPAFSIGFSAKKITYPLALAIVNARIRVKLAQFEVKEPLEVSGSIEGSLLPAHEPAVNINWQINDNTLQTEAGTFTHCSFNGNFMNTVDERLDHVDSNSRISFSNLRATWNGIPFTADSCSINNLDSARLQTHLRSKCRLEDIDNTMAMQDIAFKSGEGAFDLWYDGPIVRDKSMLGSVSGTVTIKDGAIDYTPRGFGFTQCNGMLSLFKDSLRINNFNCQYRNNRFDVALYGSNIRHNLVTGDASQPALMDCFIRSNFINMDDFTSLFGKTKQRTAAKKASGSFAATARGIDAMLDNSNIGVHVKAAAFKRGNLHANNLNAVVRFAPQDWSMEKISMDLAGGTIVCSGNVKHAADNNHAALFKLKINNADMGKLLFSFDNFGQEAITSQEISGRFSTIASLQAGINGDGHIIAGSIKGDVDFSLQQGSLQNYEPLNRLKSFVFKNRDMRSVRFAELKDKLAINGEMITVSRMEIQSSAFRLFLEGNYGLAKKNTDLLIQVPFSNLNGNSFDTDDGPVNKGIRSKTGASVWLRAVNGEDGKVKIKLTMKKKLKDIQSFAQ